MMISAIKAVNECAFEPDIAEIRCVDCGKPTGETGTCQDVGFCAICRQGYINAGVAQGLTVEESNAEFSQMLITMIEGRGYKLKFKPRRVLHFAPDGKPVCGAKGGPHPITANRDESNCKRCVKQGAKQ